MLDGVWHQLRDNPLNWGLALLVVYFARQYMSAKPPPQIPPQPKAVVFRDFTPIELSEFDGRQSKDAPIYMAVNGRVFDVSAGRHFYGPEGPYGNFAGRDASRGLAKGSFDLDMLTPIDQPIDTLQGLDDEEKEALKDWEIHFAGKYIEVGKLVENTA
jgi:membrane-associated progesterone receptor component